VFWSEWHTLERPRDIGEVEVAMDAKSAIFIKREGDLLRVAKFVISGKMVIRKYVYNLEFAEGKSYEDAESKRPDYIELTSKGFNLEKIKEIQQGVEISQEEWNEVEKTSFGDLEMGPDIMYRMTFMGDANGKS